MTSSACCLLNIRGTSGWCIVKHWLLFEAWPPRLETSAWRLVARSFYTQHMTQYDAPEIEQAGSSAFLVLPLVS